MSEAGKTCVFVIVAIVALGVAFLSRPTAPPTAIEDLVGSKNLNVVDDPLATQELEIIRWDSATGDPVTFQVSRKDGVWKIPSHGDYPADADRQIGDAATAATNLKPLGIASDKQADHATFGVLDPESAKPGQSGVGTRVIMKDGKGESMVSTIIGKEVKDQPGQRYVRQVGKDIVYVVKIDPSKLSTKFEDWIEKDLLKLNTLDIAQVKINDYSVNIAQTQGGGLGLVDERRGEVLLDFNDSENTWSLEELLKWDETNQELVKDSIPEGEELNQVKLNDMKSALADLKIIDVQHKPAGMSADLKAEKSFVTNQQAVQNLMSRGFYAVRGPNDGIEILSSEGDFIVGLKDGVEYVLRFGGIKVGANTENVEDAAEGEEKQPKGENRFLFVAARYNPNVIPKPERPAILGEESEAGSEPEEKPDADPADTKVPADTDDAGETPAENDKESKSEGSPAVEPSAKDDAEKKEPAAEEGSGKNGSDENSSSLTPDQEDGAAVDQVVPVEEEKEVPAADSAEKPAESADNPAAKTEDAESSESKKEPAADTEKPAPTDKAADAEVKAAPDKATEGEPATEEPKKADSKEDAAKEREFAELAYNRAMDEYNDKVEKAQTQVTDLNARFGDWYYVISDEVFRKIHITRADLFKKKEVEKKEGAAAAGEALPKSSIPLQAPASIDGK